MNGQQGGDPKRRAEEIITLSDSDDLPLRFVAVEDAMVGVEQNLSIIQEQIRAYRDLSAALACGPETREGLG